LSAVQSLLQDLFSRDAHFAIALSRLARQHDIRPLVTRTLLTYLELDGYIQAGTPFYDDYKFQPRQSSADILAQFDGERRRLLHGLLRQAVRGKTWFKLDIDAAA